MVWCLSILEKRFTPKEIETRVKALYEYAAIMFPSDGCFTIEWLASVIRKIDELWYDNHLLPELEKVYGGVQLVIEEDDRHVGGVVMEGENGRVIYLGMNRKLFVSLFEKPLNGYGYHSGGLLCKDRLLCFLHVLLHETVHLILTLCDRTGHRPDKRDHGKEFNAIIRRFFGQTDSQHGLIDGYKQRHDLDTIKKCLKAKQRVEVFLNGQWHPCQVLEKKRKWVTIKLRHGGITSVHIGLFRLPPQKSTPKPRGRTSKSRVGAAPSLRRRKPRS